MNRLLMANGTWQLTILAGALRTAGVTPTPEDTRVALFGEHLSPALRETMTHFAETLFPAVPVIWWDDLLQFPELYETPFHDARERVYTSLDGFEVEAVWTSKIFTPHEKFVLACHPIAGIHLYEEGLHSFVQKAFTPGSHPLEIFIPRIAYRALRQAWHGPRGRWWSVAAPGVSALQAARIEGAWLLLGRTLGAPDYIPLESVQTINTEHVREVIESLPVPETALTEDPPDTPPFLVLGQCFSRWDRMTWEEELRFYAARLAIIRDRGYPIVWKDHPRAEPPFGPALVEELGRDVVTLIDLPQAWPVEVVASRLKLAGCATVSSSALFYLHLLYDIPTYTLADAEHLDLVSYKDFSAIASFARDHVPGIQKLPEADH
jgi:hypothetical protein